MDTIHGSDPITVLVLDEDVDLRHLFEYYAEHLGNVRWVMVATAIDAAATLTRGLRPDVAFLDFDLKGALNGGTVCQELQQTCPACIVYCLCHSMHRAKLMAPTLTIEGYIEKPFSFKLALTRARSALNRQRRELSLATHTALA